MTRIPSLDMAEESDRMVYSKTCWLSDFSSGPKKRPDHGERGGIQRETAE